ncbi:hypothetical protein [Bradyrhizobium sp. Arg816]|uniref:hypothetical protein n=1 Tax=Bradyrhizobium sp. Arg816 TaxID=2998491 RepID=UPI00249E99C7|nr:hypothetical protein [Bradyrhizobium sp. Arg816]MDI3561289.1 hypothetical protein [Bradyrhizobium sp. Arg816]
MHITHRMVFDRARELAKANVVDKVGEEFVEGKDFFALARRQLEQELFASKMDRAAEPTELRKRQEDDPGLLKAVLASAFRHSPGTGDMMPADVAISDEELRKRGDAARAGRGLSRR